MNRYYLAKNETGLHLCFLRYPTYDDFTSFLEFLQSKGILGKYIVKEGPYSIIATSTYLGNGEEITILFHDDTGCCIRLKPSDQGLAEEIMEKCK